MTIVVFTQQDALARAAGNVPGQSVVQKFGRNPAVATGSLQNVWFNGGTYPWLSAASVVHIAAGGNAADTAGGAGAREVTIQALDADWNQVTEVLATNGALASADTAVPLIRINRAFVSEIGTYGDANIGDIVLETNPGALTLANLQADFGQTQLGLFSVPNGKTAFIADVGVRYSSNRSGNVRLMRRDRADVVAAPFGSQRVVMTWTSEFSGNARARLDAWISVQQRSDIFFQVEALMATGAVDVTLDIILRDN